jgi:hypothetical protein
VSDEIVKLQKEICRKYGAPYVRSPPGLKIGITRSVWRGAEPINGLRHAPEGDTTGWYIWAGTEWSNDPDFFEPVHVNHLIDSEFDFVRFLGLGPGWRFLAQGDYEDVWFDQNLLVS